MENEPQPRLRYAGKTEEALHVLCRGAWANESQGDVGSLYGKFYRISNDPVEIPEIVEAFTDEIDQLSIDPWTLVGHYLVVEYQDIVTVTGYPSEDYLDAAWSARVTDFKLMEGRKNGGS